MKRLPLFFPRLRCVALTLYGLSALALTAAGACASLVVPSSSLHAPPTSLLVPRSLSFSHGSSFLTGLGSGPSLSSSNLLGQNTLQPYTETLPNSVVDVKMIPIPGGKVKIGGKEIDVKPFWMASTETPWEAFDLFLASGPASPPYDQTQFAPDAIARPSKSYILPDRGWGHHGFPAINLSFTSSQMFCRWLAAATKKKYRLPTEAEWQLACEQGEKDVKIDKAMLDASAWYAGNSEHKTHPVGKKQPDKLGLFDILGNVGEWAVDSDGQPVLCGGTFQDEASTISIDTAKRWKPEWQESDPQIPKSRWWLSDAPFAGFRLVCEPG